MHAKIEDHPTLYRDMDNQHIIQTDISVVHKHEARMKGIEEKKALKAEINTIKSDVQEIKKLLQALVTGQFGAGGGGASAHIPLGPYMGGAGGFVPLTVGQSFTCNTGWGGGGIGPNYGVAGNIGNPFAMWIGGHVDGPTGNTGSGCRIG